MTLRQIPVAVRAVGSFLLVANLGTDNDAVHIIVVESLWRRTNSMYGESRCRLDKPRPRATTETRKWGVPYETYRKNNRDQ